MAIICWVFFKIAGQSGAQPWAYADNWEFVAQNISEIIDSIRATRDMLEAWKLELDIKKSWMWSVFPTTKQQNQDIQQIFDNANLQVVSKAKDLGATMRYRKVLCAQHSKTRFDEAIMRTKRLIGLPITLSEKWRAILGSSVSTALYGIEIVPFGWEHFQLFRSAIANVICKSWKQRNEHLACALTHDSIADPEVLSVKRCLRLCRKFLHLYPDTGEIFLDILRDSSVDAKHIHGPFGCLKRWLLRLGWKVTQQGNLCNADGLICSLTYTCPNHIDSLVDMAWESILLTEVRHRKGMDQIPSINIRATTQTTDPTILELVQRLHQFYRVRIQYWHKFTQFLGDLTRKISDFKMKPANSHAEPQLSVEGAVDPFERLAQWQPHEPVLHFDVTLSDSQMCSLPHPAWFVAAVATWLSHLQWPEAEADDDPGVTWLELFVDCVTATKMMVPKQLGKYCGYRMFDGSGSALNVDTLNVQLVTFRSCVKLIGSILQRPVYPVDRGLNNCKALQIMPGVKPSSGVKGRPKLVSQCRTLQSIRKFFGDGAYLGTSTTWVSVFPFDRSEPVLFPSTPVDNESSAKRISKFIANLNRYRKGGA
eukprot:Skav211234  [mRNA]  locus=scaffold180:107090:109997:+ [translate_table: standard]